MKNYIKKRKANQEDPGISQDKFNRFANKCYDDKWNPYMIFIGDQAVVNLDCTKPLSQVCDEYRSYLAKKK